MNYAYILTYTTEKHKAAVIEETTKASEEEVPMISFMPFEGNEPLIKLIEQTLE